MSPARKSMLLYASIMAFALLGLFMFRSMYQPFYLLMSRYALGILVITVIMLVLYCRSLEPLRAQGEGNMSWYIGRAWSMGLVSALLAAILVYGYAYHVDDDYFTRRLDWERHELEATKMPQEVVESFMEDEYKTKPFHFEEMTLVFLTSLSTIVGATVVCCFFIGYNKRDVHGVLTT